MYKRIAFIKHKLTSTNHHGVHSPFVFDYLTKCLYSKKSYSNDKSMNVLLKSIDYFKVKSILFIERRPLAKKLVEQNLDVVTNEEAPFDLIYVERSLALKEVVVNELHNNSLILVNNIHKNSIDKVNWRLFKKKTRFTVTIDLFHCGLLFMRREQVKEHFRIRI